MLFVLYYFPYKRFKEILEEKLQKIIRKFRSNLNKYFMNQYYICIKILYCLILFSFKFLTLWDKKSKVSNYKNTKSLL